jgi:hypothetical protein
VGQFVGSSVAEMLTVAIKDRPIVPFQFDPGGVGDAFAHDVSRHSIRDRGMHLGFTTREGASKRLQCGRMEQSRTCQLTQSFAKHCDRYLHNARSLTIEADNMVYKRVLSMRSIYRDSR